MTTIYSSTTIARVNGGNVRKQTHNPVEATMTAVRKCLASRLISKHAEACLSRWIHGVNNRTPRTIAMARNGLD